MVERCDCQYCYKKRKMGWVPAGKFKRDYLHGWVVEVPEEVHPGQLVGVTRRKDRRFVKVYVTRQVYPLTPKGAAWKFEDAR